jgi:hypothetical protein
VKLEGNDFFRASRWDEALNTYRTALGRLPKIKERPGAREDGFPSEVGESVPRDVEADKVGPLEGVKTELEGQCAKARAILNANIGACYIKLVRLSLIFSLTFFVYPLFYVSGRP